MYVGSEGIVGYKSLLNANKTVLEGDPHNMTLDIENLEGIPIENNFGSGTKLITGRKDYKMKVNTQHSTLVHMEVHLTDLPSMVHQIILH